MVTTALSNCREAVGHRTMPWERPLALIFVISAYAIRMLSLDAKGLSYDEAASALMSRASYAEIVAFHWNAAFEHLPLWIIHMRLWSEIAGQTEYMLRFPTVLAAAGTVPLLWSLQRKVRPHDIGWRAITAALLCLSPILLLYAQEARMYAFVVFFGVASVLLLLELLERPRLITGALFVAVNWWLLSLQYYSALLIGACALFALFTLIAPPSRSKLSPGSSNEGSGTPWWIPGVAFLCSLLPLLLWMPFSPGFQETLRVVLREASGTHVTHLAFLADLWTDLSFGAIRWQPVYSRIGFALFPIFAVGLYASFVDHTPGGAEGTTYYSRWAWLFALTVFVPLIFSALMFRTLATRYLLYIVPFVLAFVGYGIAYLWRWVPVIALFAGAAAISVGIAGTIYYFGPYTKSEYREMAEYVVDHLAEDTDSVLIEAPRQYLLASYYFGEDFPVQPVPDIDLPGYWPITAPRLVPEETDDLVQDEVNRAQSIWLILSAAPEVDPGEFLPKYLSAVSYEYDCHNWLDVRLCRYVSPSAVQPQIVTEPRASYDGGLVLESAALAVDGAFSLDGEIPLFVTLDWSASQRPAADYKVSLRVSDRAGAVIGQTDAYPIGPLLPPSTWNAGDEKPGFMVVLLPRNLPPGPYSIVAELYDPNIVDSVAHTTKAGYTDEPIVLGQIEIDDTMRLLPPEASTGY